MGNRTDVSAVVLTQQRVHLHYRRDKEGRCYHFPDKYRSQINSGDTFVYYHPVEQGTQEKSSYYFGVGRIGQITRDQEVPDHWYAEIVEDEYHEFPHPVYFKDGQGRYLEGRLDIKKPAFQRAVRRIEQRIYCRILSLSGLVGDHPRLWNSVAACSVQMSRPPPWSKVRSGLLQRAERVRRGCSLVASR